MNIILPLNELKMKIDNLTMLIELQEQSFRTAVQSQTDFIVLEGIRDNIKQLKAHLQGLRDKHDLDKTDDLPDETKPDKSG